MNSNIFNCNYKLLHHPKAMEDIRKHGDCFPINVEYHPTMRCNHQCVRCATVVDKVSVEQGYLEHTETAGDNQSEWAPEEAEKLILGFAGVGVKAVTFGGGGEPLLHPTIFKQMALAYSAGMEFGLITNLDAELDSVLMDAAWIRVSADAATEETHNKLHRPNRAKMGAVGFTRMMDNLKWLMSERPCAQHPTIGINFLLQEENIHEIAKAVEVYANLADYIRFTPVHDDREGSWYSVSELGAAFSRAKELAAKLNPDFKVIGAIDRVDNMVANQKDYPSCYWQRIRPVVGADGWLYPCCVLNYYSKYRILDLRAYKCFREAWDSTVRQDRHDYLYPKTCPPCWVDNENRMACYLAKKDPPHVEFV